VTAHIGGGTPVLLLHGLDDTSVPPTQSLDLAAALLRAGHRVHAMTTDGCHEQLDLNRSDVIEFVRQFLNNVL